VVRVSVVGQVQGVGDDHERDQQRDGSGQLELHVRPVADQDRESEVEDASVEMLQATALYEK